MGFYWELLLVSTVICVFMSILLTLLYAMFSVTLSSFKEDAIELNGIVFLAWVLAATLGIPLILFIVFVAPYKAYKNLKRLKEEDL